MDGELAGILAFVPLFGVLTVALIALTHGVGKLFGLRVPDAMDAFGAFLALGLTTVIFVWLNCAIFVSLPFADPACQMLGF